MRFLILLCADSIFAALASPRVPTSNAFWDSSFSTLVARASTSSCSEVTQCSCSKARISLTNNVHLFIPQSKILKFLPMNILPKNFLKNFLCCTSSCQGGRQRAAARNDIFATKRDMVILSRFCFPAKSRMEMNTLARVPWIIL